MTKRIEINSDMGESFGLYKIGNDEAFNALYPGNETLPADSTQELHA